MEIRCVLWVYMYIRIDVEIRIRTLNYGHPTSPESQALRGKRVSGELWVSKDLQNLLLQRNLRDHKLLPPTHRLTHHIHQEPHRF